jgi:hypothetical protein
MKPDQLKSPITVDRPATSEEVRAAALHFPDPIEEYRAEILREIEMDLGGYIRIPSVDLETSLLVEEFLQEQDTLPN